MSSYISIVLENDSITLLASIKFSSLLSYNNTFDISFCVNIITLSFLSIPTNNFKSSLYLNRLYGNHPTAQGYSGMAKELQRLADKMVTYGKKGDLVSRRKALAFLQNDKDAAKKVFEDYLLETIPVRNLDMMIGGNID